MSRRPQRSHNRFFIPIQRENTYSEPQQWTNDIPSSSRLLASYAQHDYRSERDVYRDGRDVENNCCIHPEPIRVNLINRRKPSIPTPVVNCPKALRRAKIEDESECFRRPFLNNVVLYKRQTGPFQLSSKYAIATYTKYQRLIGQETHYFDKFDLTNEEEYATIGPSGCVEYLKKRQRNEIRDGRTIGFVKFTPKLLSWNEREAHFLSSAEIMLFSARRLVSTKGNLSDFLDFDFNNSPRTTRSFDFTNPRTPYYLELKSNGSCVIVPNSTVSPYAIIEIPEFELNNKTVTEYCEKKFGNNIRFEIKRVDIVNKLVYGANKRHLKKNSYLIKFENYRQRNKVATQISLLDADFGVTGALDYSKPYESVSIEVRYDTTRTNRRVAKIRMRNETDANRAKDVFLENGFKPEESNYGNNREIYIPNIPEYVEDFRYLEWFVKSILIPNNLEYDYLHFDTVNVKELDEKCRWNLSRYTEPIVLFARQLIGLACRLEIWRGVRIEYDDDLDPVAINRTMHPFHIEEIPKTNHHDSRENGEKRMIARYFGRNVQMGLSVAEEVMKKCGDPYFLQFTGTRLFPARVFPKYRKLLPVTRSVRIACNRGISEFDNKLRSIWSDYERENPEEFARGKMEKHSLRVIDLHDEESEDVLTGIEGWPPSCVDQQLDNLRTIFNPKELVLAGDDKHLSYGRGELFVRHVVDEMEGRVVVDFDRFNSRLLVFGDKTDQFIETVQKFSTENLNVLAKIHFCAPYFNDNMRSLVKKNILKEMGRDFSSKIEINKEEKCIVFDGPFVSFKVFSDILSDINKTISEKLSSQLPLLVKKPMCPICQSDPLPDFYRLDACGHVYCRGCVNNLVRYTMENSRPLPQCYFQNCKKIVCPMDVKDIILGDENRVKSLDAEKLKMFFLRTIDGVVHQPGSKFRACKTTDCPGLLESNGSRREIALCILCDKQYCMSCLEEPHPDVVSCEEYSRIRKDVELSLERYTSTRGSAKFKRCPTRNCAAVIEKGEGCNHVECPYCKIHFCWECLYTSERMGDLYAHMSEIHGGVGGQLNLNDDY